MTLDVEKSGIANATNEPKDDEIEITEEMIEAGVDAYFECWDRKGAENWVVEEIFKAMARAQKRGPKYAGKCSRYSCGRK
jgi:hypothetical protein